MGRSESILSNLTSLLIRSEYIRSNDTGAPMRKIVFVSYLDLHYSRSGVLASAMRKVTSLETQVYRLDNFRIYELVNFALYLRRLDFETTSILIMSPAQVLTMFARFFFKGSIILDAGWPLSDSSRIRKGVNSFSYVKDLFIDLIAMKISDKVILESRAQVRNLKARRFKFRSEPLVIYTGVLENRFESSKSKRIQSANTRVIKNSKFKVIFRGKYNKESGLEYIQEIFASRCDDWELIVCSADLPSSFPRVSGVRYLTQHISDSELIREFKTVDMALGQFGTESRVKISIAHKIYEYAFFGIPTICIQDTAVEEIFKRDEFYFIKREDLGKFLDSCLEDRNIFAKELQNRSVKIREKYSRACSEVVIAQEFMKIFEDI